MSTLGSRQAARRLPDRSLDVVRAQQRAGHGPSDSVEAGYRLHD